MAIQTNHSTESLKPDSGVLEIDATGALALPAGTETERPLGAAAGHIRFDQTSTKPEYFNGTVWDKITSKTYVDAADQNLQNQINNILSNIDPAALDSLTEIVQAFQNSDGSLTDAINALSNTLNADLAQEILDRTQGDNDLYDTIQTVIEGYQTADQLEEDARIAGDATLQDNIDAEALSRTNADTNLQLAIDAEENSRIAGDTTLQNNLNAVEANLQAQINSILSNLDPAALDSLTEIVAAFQNADTGLLASINNLIAEATADLDQERLERIAADASETAARLAADAINAAAINAERDRALAAEQVLQDNIDAEALARTNADNVLQSNINAEALARTNADDVLQDNIDAEATARIAGDQTLQDNINTEALARTNADNVLQSNIDAINLDFQSDLNAEALARTNADNILQDNINAEALARTNADNVLQDNLDQEAVLRYEEDQALYDSIADVIEGYQTADQLEEDARIAADQELQSNIDAEEAARIAGDLDVRSYVDSLIDQTSNTIENLSLDDLTDVQVTSSPTEGQSLVYDSTIGLFRPKTNALAPITRSFIGDGMTMEFDIIDSVPSPNNLVVVINGIAQQPFYSYTVVDGNRLLFDEAPEANDIIEVRVLKGSATTDRPRPIVSNIAYSTIASFNVITFNATDITYGTGAKINGVPIQRIDYPTPNSMQLMFEYSFAAGLYSLTLVDTNGNETVYPNIIRIGGGAEWTDSVQFIGSFSGGDAINFAVGVNSGSTLTLGAAAPGETAPTWLSVSGLNIVGTAPVNSSPTRYEFKVTATNGAVNITRNYWLVVV